MLKSIRIKSILAFIIVGMIVISLLGFSYMKSLENLKFELEASTEISELSNIINNQIHDAKIVIGISVGVFVLLMLVIGTILFKIITAPISNLIKVVENATKDVKYLEAGRKKNEINNLVNAFDTINNELKENLNEVTRQKKQMETILLHMTDGIIAFNIDGDIIHINLAAKTFLNLNEEKNFEEVFDRYSVDINLEKIIYLENWTSSVQKINIEDRTINLFFAPFRNENDRPAGLIVVIQDITEHVKLDTMRKQFVADVSHELKTPITSIMGYSDTLLEGDVDAEMTHKFLERISGEAARMSRLVSDLLILSKYDTSKVKLEKSEFDLGELVKYTYDGLEIERKRKIKLENVLLQQMFHLYLQIEVV